MSRTWAGAAPDRAPVSSGGARQGAVAVSGRTAGIAPARVGAADREAPPVSARIAAGSAAEESVWGRSTLCADQWKPLTQFLQDGELEIDNGATERASRDIAIGRGNWTLFGSDSG